MDLEVPLRGVDLAQVRSELEKALAALPTTGPDDPDADEFNAFEAAVAETLGAVEKARELLSMKE